VRCVPRFRELDRDFKGIDLNTVRELLVHSDMKMILRASGAGGQG
jgi:hypothetical protein